VGRQERGDLGLITILMDVDHFKKLNDEFGHAVGDGVLKDVVVVLQDIVGPRGMVARYGGEEFCVVMERARVDEGVRMAERIRSAIHELLEHPYRVTASFGVSGSQLGAKSLQAQLQQSDQGLYAAKRAGRNAVRCWSVQLERETRDIERRAVERQNQTPIEDHPISYHAVVALCAAVAHRNPSLAAHCQRVAEMAAAVGRGLLSIDSLYVLEIAAMLHEVGMIGQYSEAMSGRDRSQWTSERLVKMQQRNRIGLEIIRSSMHSQPLIDMLQFQWQVYGKASEVGLQPEEIPLGARILAVVNTYDDMTSPERGTPMTHPAACERLRQMAGRELDPMIVERFIDLGVGWRHSGRIEKTSIDGRLAVILGYQMERLLHSYSERNAPLLKTRLQSLSQIAHAIDLPPMKHLVLELSNEVDRKAISDWQSLLPMVEDLLELGMMIQREFLRSDRVFCET
jgi:diguanylate cyclase (GGDEF)-like protein